jgi:hypothetical protein
MKNTIELSAITVALDNPFPISVGETTFTITFKDELTVEEVAILVSIVSQHTGIYNPVKEPREVTFASTIAQTSDGRIRTVGEKSVTSKINIHSHDWTDKTTWYGDSVRVVDEVATSVDYITYSLTHQSIIDIYHGKLVNEDVLEDSANNSYRVVVKVNDVTKIEKDPHYDIIPNLEYVWHYQVNYDDGKIIFQNALTETDVVEVTYHYATTSTFYVRPAPTKTLEIDYVEGQFSDDIEIYDTITFEPWGYAGVFAPQLGYPFSTMIPLGSNFVYKGIRDYVSDSTHAYPNYGNLSSSTGWRGLTNTVTVFSWNYVRATQLISEYGMEIRIKLQHEEPFGGSFCTVSFYCGVVDPP